MVKEKPSLFGGKQARFGGARPISDVDNKSRMRCASCMNNCYLFALLFLFSDSTVFPLKLLQEFGRPLKVKGSQST